MGDPTSGAVVASSSSAVGTVLPSSNSEPEAWALSPKELAEKFAIAIDKRDVWQSGGVRNDTAAARLSAQGPNRVIGTEAPKEAVAEANAMEMEALQTEHSAETIGSDADSAFLSSLPRGLLERFCLRLMDGAARCGLRDEELLPDNWARAVDTWCRVQRSRQCERYTRPRAMVRTVRQGVALKVSSEEVVEGDIVFMAAGDTAHADLVVIDVDRKAGPAVLSLSALCGVRASSQRTVHRAADDLTASTNVIPSGAMLRSGAVACVAYATGIRSRLGQLVRQAEGVPRPLQPPGMAHLPGDANARLSHVPGVALNNRRCGALLPHVTALVVEKEALGWFLPPPRVVRVACAGDVFDMTPRPGGLDVEDALRCDEEGDEILRLHTGGHPPRLFLGAVPRGDNPFSVGRVGPLPRSVLLEKPLIAARLAADAVGRAGEGSIDPAVEAVAEWARGVPRLDGAAEEYTTAKGGYRYFPQLRLHASVHYLKAKPTSGLLLLYGAAEDVLTVSPLCLRSGGAVPLSAAARRDVVDQLKADRLWSSPPQAVGFAAAEIGQHLALQQTRPVWESLGEVQELVSQLSSACFLGAAVVAVDRATPAAGRSLAKLVERGVPVHVVTPEPAAVLRHTTGSPSLEGVRSEIRECEDGRGGALLAEHQGSPSKDGSGVIFHARIQPEGVLELVNRLRGDNGIPCVCVSSMSTVPAARAALLSVSAVPEDGWWDPESDRTEASSRVLIDGVDAAAYVRSNCHMQIAPDGLPLLAELLCAVRGGERRSSSEHLCGSAAALRKL
eukprot:Hpha_TRINITY_DN15892_c0_g2::TRINITY_DN15892_c0_g2_i1::g.187265::m.187265